MMCLSIRREIVLSILLIITEAIVVFAPMIAVSVAVLAFGFAAPRAASSKTDWIGAWAIGGMMIGSVIFLLLISFQGGMSLDSMRIAVRAFCMLALLVEWRAKLLQLKKVEVTRGESVQ